MGAIQIAPIACAAIVWWLYYDLECWMNGATGRWRVFQWLWNDIRFNLPGGWERRLKTSRGDAEWAAEFPGISHLLGTHVFLPLGVWAAVRFFCT
jgi:hypothetical protein